MAVFHLFQVLAITSSCSGYLSPISPQLHLTLPRTASSPSSSSSSTSSTTSATALFSSRLRNLVDDDDPDYPYMRDASPNSPNNPSVRDGPQSMGNIGSGRGASSVGNVNGNNRQYIGGQYENQYSQYSNQYNGYDDQYEYMDERQFRDTENMFRRNGPDNRDVVRRGGNTINPNANRRSTSRPNVSTTLISDLRARAMQRREARRNGNAGVGGAITRSNRSGRNDRPGRNNRVPAANLNSLNVVEKYYEAWNQRNIPLALSCFDDYVYYDDTQFAKPFVGKEKLAEHLIYVADCLPDGFEFVVDGLSVGAPTLDRGGYDPYYDSRDRRGGRDMRGSGRRSSTTVSISALWHVENEYGPLPYARGCSFYKVDPSTNLILEGYDFPEPAVLKPGSAGLRLLSIASKLIEEPVRFLPLALWIGYIYVVFFSDGILPGANALKFETRTWEEVRNLSLNFFFVAPVLELGFSPKVHPLLEATFNFLLAWAAMFAGFLSDDRSGAGSRPGMNSRDRSSATYYETIVRNQEMRNRDGNLVPRVNISKRNLLPMFPMIIGMQFLTSAFLLPYLVCRTSERTINPSSIRNQYTRPLYKEELDPPARIFGEWKGLGVLMGHVGVFSIYWGLAGRADKFGPPLWSSSERWASFLKLLSIDRVGSSFVVDLIIFGLFQGWLIEDDFNRRARSQNPEDEETFLKNVAKIVPFWGLALYLCFRPSLPSEEERFDYYSYENERNGRDGMRNRNSDDAFGRLRDSFNFFNDR